jgi:hypothetical protein
MADIINEFCYPSSIDEEKEFIELLGYNLVEGKNDGYLGIVDKDENIVGYLNYDDKKYHTFIDSKEIFCDSTGNLDDKKHNKVFEYEIKGKYHVNFTLNHVQPFWNGRLLFINNDDTRVELSLNPDGQLELSQTLKKYGCEITQKLVYFHDRNYCYSVWLSNEGESNKNYISFSASSDLDTYNVSVVRDVVITSDKHDKNEDILEGKPSYWLLKHQRGIDFFQSVRTMVNEIIPIKDDDTIRYILTPKVIVENHLKYFFPDYEKEKTI